MPSESARMLQGRVPEAVYLAVGDSTSARFDGLVLEGAAGPIVMKARWQPVSRMQDTFADGKISEYLTRILMEMRYVRRTEDTQWPFPRLFERITGGGPAFNYEPRNPDRCVLLFSFGESDLLDLAHLCPPGPFERGWAEHAVQSRCQPLFDAIRSLKRIGYSNLFLHGITPPTRYEEPPFPPYASRLGLALTGREIFERFAQETGIGHISIWDDVFSEEAGRDPRYARDHVHLNPQSAILSARRLCEQLEQKGFYR